jgi:RNA polymerase sigma-70 factor (ECF subfamily)
MGANTERGACNEALFLPLMLSSLEVSDEGDSRMGAPYMWHVALVEEESSSGESSPTLAGLEEAVRRLPEPMGALYRLRAGGLSYEEVAVVLGVPLGTVKSRMHELLSRLRKETSS